MQQPKLVRDRIIEIMEAKGLHPAFHIADEHEYHEKLHEKLQEEVKEYLDSEEKEEIADILEVLDAICQQKGFSPEEIQAIKQKKYQERGRFAKRIISEMNI